MKIIFYKSIKLISYTIAGFIGFIAVYFLCAITLSYIPVNNNFTPTTSGIDIYILSNGIHTDLVLPTKNEYKNWTKEIPYENTLSKDSRANFMAFGWGEKGFYLETPKWKDLKISTVLKAMFALNTCAMHITNYNYLKENNECKKITISPEQYKKLVEYIESSLIKNTSGNCYFFTFIIFF